MAHRRTYKYIFIKDITYETTVNLANPTVIRTWECSIGDEGTKKKQINHNNYTKLIIKFEMIL